MKNEMNESQLVEKLNTLNRRYVLAIWTDKTDFVNNVDCVHNLLEVRAFDENGEFRAYRSVVGTKFKIRDINNDDDKYANRHYDEVHYLDIDTVETEKQNDGFTYTTGGGRYHLPESDMTMLKVRYFYKFDDNGIARKCDWRLVGFTDKEDAEWQN